MYLKDLLRYRNVWLGLAMIWVVFFHTEFYTGFVVLDMIKNTGYGGVDICLFASGIGCYYSLSSDSDYVNFLKRRFKRIMPTYFLFIIVWLLYMFLCGDFGWRMAIGNLFAIQEFTGLGQSFNWYISAILLFYILAPYFKRMVDKASFIKNLLIVSFLVILSVPFWESNIYIIMVTRIPIFYIGMFFGKICKQNKKMNNIYALSLAMMFIVGISMLIVFFKFGNTYVWSHGLYWYPFILITPPLCIAISYFVCFLEKFYFFKGLSSMVSLIGKYSFEVYLLHIPLISIIYKLIRMFELQEIQVLIWLLGLVCLIIGCFILRRMSNLFLSLLEKKKHD